MYTRSLPILCALFAAMFFTPLAQAALDEKPIMDDINDIIAVLHGLEMHIVEIKRNLNTVRAARAATKKQYDAINDLINAEKAKGHKAQVRMYTSSLLRLKKQTKKLQEFDFETSYAREIKKLNKQIAHYKLTLEARKVEFRTLFGKEPTVNLSYRREIDKMKIVRPNASEYLAL